jgi:hypothetical protein
MLQYNDGHFTISASFYKKYDNIDSTPKLMDNN